MSGFIKKFLFGYRGLLLLALLIFSVLLQFLYLDYEVPFLPQWASTLIVISLCVVAGYFVAVKLVPGFLYKKKKGKFIAWIIIIAMTNSILIYLVAGSFYSSLSGKSLFPGLFYFLYMVSFFFVANIIIIMIAIGVQIISDRYRLEETLKQIEQDKIRTELDFLRAQINPHFLFNVLNTIYFQINPENGDARESVEKLSEILRYQLYEYNTDKIEIRREINNLKNYVSIQSLRLEKGTNITFEVNKNLPDFKLAPLLLMTLIENAFKHISNFKNPAENQLYIYFNSPKSGIFELEINNTYNSASKNIQLVSSSGMGLVNLRRRLNLLYPERHQLEITKNGIWYNTKLKIAYDDQLSPGG